MVYLPGGPSHIDLYDMKPDAPVGDPRRVQADQDQRPRHRDLRADAAARRRSPTSCPIVRGFQTPGSHDSQMLTTGFRPADRRPAFGSVVSRMRADRGAGLPPYVSLVEETNLPFGEEPGLPGAGARPLRPARAGHGQPQPAAGDDARPAGATARGCSRLRRDAPRRGRAAQRAKHGRLHRPGARHGPLRQGPRGVRPEPGAGEGARARTASRRARSSSCWPGGSSRRACAVVTLCGGWVNNGEGNSPSNLSNWDTHEDNFDRLRVQAPAAGPRPLRPPHRPAPARARQGRGRGRVRRDGPVAAHRQAQRRRQRLLDRPRPLGDRLRPGLRRRPAHGPGRRRDRPPRRDGPKGQPFTPQNLLATLYHLLGIDPATTLPDHNGRPQFLLDDRAKISELL